MARTETVMSVLLSDPPAVLVAPALLRGLGLVARDPDFQASVDAHLTESLAEFDARLRRAGR